MRKIVYLVSAVLTKLKQQTAVEASIIAFRPTLPAIIGATQLATNSDSPIPMVANAGVMVDPADLKMEVPKRMTHMRPDSCW